ncbi:MAG: bifunctional homocysteine S-methyltransferase/methylenetetrahydrofolate reductase [Eubacterium sp.]|nr:bifunctional homocysteine S-methyltransferase/methylenetetrahydrofolate reductase [Eubacterium sp.]
MNRLKETLKNGIMIMDGGMGTYYASKTDTAGRSCEFANLSEPELIKNIHREYIDAGAQIIKTNTFSVNRVNMQGDEELAELIIEKGYNIAKDAAKDDCFCICDIGPVPVVNEDVIPKDEYIWVADKFLSLGADAFLFETLENYAAPQKAASHIKSKNPDAFVILSFAVMADGFTRDGIFAADIISALKDDENVDIIGFNCACSPGHMLSLLKETDLEGVNFSVAPNAGYPVIIQNKSLYDVDPKYFAEQMVNLAECGAVILGGCCGTTPEHISQMEKALANPQKPATPAEAPKEEQSSEEMAASLFWDKLINGEKVIAVELDPPSDVGLTKFMSGAWALKGAGADIITIADCPIGRARMDSSILACKIRRELNIDALPHMTCRDRNLNATKALLLGLYAEGIRNVLLVTGDPVPTAERDEVKSVFQFNSRKLAAFVNTLGKTQLPSPFHLFGALDLNAHNFNVQLRLAKEKVKHGIIGFLTQPVLSDKALENLKLARNELDAYILGGIIPVVSAKNARFMDNEVNGINVDPSIIEMYEGLNRDEAEDLAVKLSTDFAHKMADYVDGYYFMTPFGRTGLITRIIENL